MNHPSLQPLADDDVDCDDCYDEYLPRHVRIEKLRVLPAFQKAEHVKAPDETKCNFYKFFFDRDEPLMAKIYNGHTKYVAEEVNLLLNLNHKNLLSIHSAIIGSHPVHPEQQVALGIITPAYSTDLADHIEEMHTPEEGKKLEPFSFEEIMRNMDVLRGIARGLRNLHSMRIMHRDLKPSNIFLDDDDGMITPKIADFETARTVRRGDDITHLQSTVKYLAPEAHGKHHVFASDVWSFGLLAAKLFTDQDPFQGIPAARTVSMTSVLEDSSKLRMVMKAYDHAGIIRKLPGALRSVIESCLQVDPAARPTAGKLCSLLREVCESLNHMAPPVGKLYRVIYMSQKDFSKGLFAKDPLNDTHTLEDHIRDGSIDSRFVSTTTLFEWALWYASKTYVTTGYVENRFIVEIDVAKLVKHKHVRFHNKRSSRGSQLKGQFANFAASAQEVCLEAAKGSEHEPVVPNECIAAVYQLPVATGNKGFASCHKFGLDGQRQVHILDLKHPSRTEYVCAGLYLCTQYESFKNWIELYLRAFNAKAKAQLLQAMTTSKAAVVDFLKSIKHGEEVVAEKIGLANLRERLRGLGGGVWGNKIGPMKKHLEEIVRRRGEHWRTLVGETEDVVNELPADPVPEIVPASPQVKKFATKVLLMGTEDYLSNPAYNQRIRGTDEGYYYPVGFKSQRGVTSYKHKGGYTRLICEIRAGEQGPLFVVTAEDDEARPCTGSTPAKALDEMFKRMGETHPSAASFFQIPRRHVWLQKKGLLHLLPTAPAFEQASLVFEGGNLELWVASKQQRESLGPAVSGVFVDEVGTPQFSDDVCCAISKSNVTLESLRVCVKQILSELHKGSTRDEKRDVVIYCNDGTFHSIVVACATLMYLKQASFADCIKTLLYMRPKDGTIVSSAVSDVSIFKTLHYSDLEDQAEQQYGVLNKGKQDYKKDPRFWKYGRYYAPEFKSAINFRSYKDNTVKTRYVCEVKIHPDGGPLFIITADDDKQNPLQGRAVSAIVKVLENKTRKSTRNRHAFFQFPAEDKHPPSSPQPARPGKRGAQESSTSTTAKVPRQSKSQQSAQPISSNSANEGQGTSEQTGSSNAVQAGRASCLFRELDTELWVASIDQRRTLGNDYFGILVDPNVNVGKAFKSDRIRRLRDPSELTPGDIKTSAKFVNDSLKHGKRVVIYCSEGNFFSLIVGCAVIMRKSGKYTCDEAMSKIRDSRIMDNVTPVAVSTTIKAKIKKAVSSSSL